MPYPIPVDICYLIFELENKYNTVPGLNEYFKEAQKPEMPSFYGSVILSQGSALCVI